MQKHLSFVQDTMGNALAGASVRVNTAGTTTLATLYSDNGTTSKANPMTSEADGSYWFFAQNGLYDVVVTKSGFTFDASDTANLQLYDPLSPTVGTIILRAPNLTLWTLSVDNDGILSVTS